MSNDLVNGREAAKMLDCSYSYLYVLMRDGKLHRVAKPSIKKNQPLQFRRSEVEQLMEQAKEHDEEANARVYVA